MQLRCTNCGGSVPIEEATEYITCEYCKVPLYVEMKETVRHLLYEYQLEKSACAPYLQRSLQKKEIRETIEIGEIKKLFVPYWLFRSSKVKSAMICAASPGTYDMEIKDIPTLKSKIFPKEKQNGTQRWPATKTKEQAQAEFLAKREQEMEEDLQVDLMEVPFYEVRYIVNKKEYKALINGINGETHTEEWPTSSQRRKDRIFVGMAVGIFGIFLLQAIMIPSPMLVFMCYSVTAVVAYQATRFLLKTKGW